MKVDEPFNPNAKSGLPPEGLRFRPAEQKDFAALTDLMAERNPQTPRDSIDRGIQRELDTMKTDMEYKLYVAALPSQADATCDEIVGFCRFYNSTGLPVERKKYPSPEGWYGMGILVKPKFRRQGIARYLTKNRVEVLRALGVRELYSIVDSTNETSKRMHIEFGFEQVAAALGFLHMTLESGTGYLYRLKL